MINKLKLEPTKTLHLLLHQLTIKSKVNLLHHLLLQLNNKELLLLHHLLDISISKHLLLLLLHPLLDINISKHLLLNRSSSAQTVPDPEEDKMIVDNIWRT